MKHRLETVQSLTNNLPYMDIEHARRLTSIIEKNKYRLILELGTYHGVSTCYLANAVHPWGHVTTIDMHTTKNLRPSVYELADKLGFGLQDIEAINEASTFNWSLLKMVELNHRFDMVYIDGGHRLEAAGLAFFLCDQLLLPGGCLVVDDLNWRYDDNITASNAAYVKSLPAEERQAMQVRRLWESIIKTHPNYHNFSEVGEWPSGIAYKK